MSTKEQRGCCEVRDVERLLTMRRTSRARQNETIPPGAQLRTSRTLTYFLACYTYKK